MCSSRHEHARIHTHSHTHMHAYTHSHTHKHTRGRNNGHYGRCSCLSVRGCGCLYTHTHKITCNKAERPWSPALSRCTTSNPLGKPFRASIRSCQCMPHTKIKTQTQTQTHAKSLLHPCMCVKCTHACSACACVCARVCTNEHL